MAFPQVADADTTNGTVTGNSASWTLTYPANIGAGDLLIALIGRDGGFSSATDAIAGWTLGIGASGSGASCAIVFAKVATGTETGTFTYTVNGAEQGGWRVLRIPAGTWFGGALLTEAGDSDSMAATRLNNGTNQNPNPPALNPTTWDIEDTLWFAIAGVDTSRTFSAFPTNYTNTSSDVSGGSNGGSLGVARRENAVASEDPGTFTISAADDWGVITLAIRPAAGGAAVASFPPFRPNRAIRQLLGR